MRLVATCPEDIKPVLLGELQALGVVDPEPRFRAVAFETDPSLAYALHLRLRTASRLLRIVREVPAHTPAMLRSQVRRIRWPELFDARHAFRVDPVGVGRGADGAAARQVLTQVREGVRESFAVAGLAAPKVDAGDPKVVIVAHLERGRCTLAFDTTGKSLHKRGYRASGHPAPLKETLAAAILRLASYDGTQAFLDPMCGSGTLAIEAATIALAKPPQIHRRKGEFLLEWLADFDRSLWRETQDRLRGERREAPAAPIVASDVDAGYVELARRSAIAARVERDIRFGIGRVQDVEPPAGQGILVTNLPYGERIGAAAGEVADLYAEIGDVLKRRFAGWNAVLLAAEASPWKAIGLRPARSIALRNGRIPCRLLTYELYPGTRRRLRP